MSRPGWTLLLSGVGTFIIALDTLVVSTALSTLRTDLGASLEQLEWIVNAYSLAFAVLLMTGAALGDRFGRRRMFSAGLGVFAAGSAACALAGSAGALIAARALQGVGAALVLPLSLALVATAFPPERRGAAIGILGAITGLAVASGPLVGGAVVEGIAWEWIFWLNVPIALGAIPLVQRRLAESHGPDRRLDLGGLLLVTAGALGVVWGLIRADAAGWAGAEVLGAMGAGVALLVAFVVWERRVPEPMLPLRLFRSRSFSAGNAAAFLSFAALFGTVFLMAQFLQVALGEGPLGAGLKMLPWTGMLMIVAPIAGALADRYGERPFLTGGLALQAAGLGWLALVAEPGVAYSSLVAPLVVAGIGISAAIPTGQNLVVGAVAAGELGKAAGTNSMMRELGGVLGIALLAAVFAGAGGYGSPAEFSHGFSAAMGVAAALSLLGALAGVATAGAGGRLPGRTRPARLSGSRKVTARPSSGEAARRRRAAAARWRPARRGAPPAAAVRLGPPARPPRRRPAASARRRLAAAPRPARRPAPPPDPPRRASPRSGRLAARCGLRRRDR
jgi:EmrB/QacA subfamily drug resistance transporter